ncbi:MAG: efflux transporter outer membrane subunit [Kiritimatiellae bacterium]|nr:efflux transporter outer membrane subunit [Kiritimatiellia bacterium]
MTSLFFKSVSLRIIPGVFALLLAGCAFFTPSIQEPADEPGAPEAFRTGPGGALPVSNKWWEVFSDPELNRLIEEGLTNNTSVAQADARLRQAMATARKERSSLYPAFNLGASAAEKKQHTQNDDGDSTTTTIETYGLNLACSYELDLWGRLRAARQSSALDALATAADRDTVMITLSAEIALRYYELIVRDEAIRLLEHQLESNRQTLELIDLRFRRAQATALDVFQQRQVVADTAALIPLQRGEREGVADELSILLGRMPVDHFSPKINKLPDLPPLPAAGLPADLLLRRPDVQAAWLRFSSAAWGVEAARANRLPTLSITAAGSTESETVSALFDNWLLNLAGNLTAPLIDGGRRAAEVERTRAVLEGQSAAYRETALQAVGEVQQALRMEDAQRKNLNALNEGLLAAQQSRKQALLRYGQGVENYLRVITAIISEDQLQRENLNAHYQLLAYRIQLYRSLSGTWGDSLP